MGAGQLPGNSAGGASGSQRNPSAEEGRAEPGEVRCTLIIPKQGKHRISFKYTDPLLALLDLPTPKNRNLRHGHGQKRRRLQGAALKGAHIFYAYIHVRMYAWIYIYIDIRIYLS